MAATRAWLETADSSRRKTASRLGSQYAEAHADTWATFATAHVNRDGSGYIEVRRNGKVLHDFHFYPEDEAINK